MGNSMRFARSSLVAAAALLACSNVAAAQVSLMKLKGAPTDDDLGASVARIGDVDGDGRADFVLGVPGADGPGSDAGAARVVSGFDGSTLRTVSGVKAGDRLGNAVAGGGDVDGDGFPDFAAGSFLMENGTSMQGGVRVVSGATGAVLYSAYGDSAIDWLGMRVAFVGDVDGDGLEEVAASAPYDDNTGNDSGSVRLYEGPAGVAVLTIDGSQPDGGFGRALDGIGDASGDGLDDLAIGAMWANAGASLTGQVRVVSGATGLLHYAVSGGMFQNLGIGLARAGDLDGDSLGDFLAATSQNVVRLHSGANGAIVTNYGAGSSGDGFGGACGLAGDFNGDGDPDVVVGAWGSDLNGTDSGAAFVFSGATSSLLQILPGSAAFENLGSSVAGIGDVNFDGRADLAIGAPDAASPGFNGAASIFVGLPAGCANLPGSGDLNVDGVPDACQFCQPNLAAGGPGNLHLQICGDPLTFTGSVTTLGLKNGTPGGLFFLLASTSHVATPAFGGTLWPLPVLAIVPGTFLFDGTWRLQIPGGPSGPVKVYLQAIAPWPGGSKPYEISGPTLLNLGF